MLRPIAACCEVSVTISVTAIAPQRSPGARGRPRARGARTRALAAGSPSSALRSPASRSAAAIQHRDSPTGTDRRDERWPIPREKAQHRWQRPCQDCSVLRAGEPFGRQNEGRHASGVEGFEFCATMADPLVFSDRQHPPRSDRCGPRPGRRPSAGPEGRCSVRGRGRRRRRERAAYAASRVSSQRIASSISSRGRP